MTTPRDPEEALRATLVVLAPALFGPALAPPWPGGPFGQAWPLVVPSVAAFALVAPAVRDGAPARALASAGLVASGVGWCLAHPERAGVGGLLLVGVAALLAGLWPARDGSVFRALDAVPVAASVAGALAVLGWTAALVGPGGGRALAGSALAAAALALRDAGSRRDRQVATIALLWPFAWVLLREAAVLPRSAVPLLAAGPAALLVRGLPVDRVWAPVGRWLAEHVVSSPPRLLITSFLGLSAAGTVLLALPLADRAGRGLPLVDALFTAVSAVTVTGLATVEPSALTPFGRLVLIALVQLGGLGLLAYATAQLLGVAARTDLRRALRAVFGVVLAVEGAGALLLGWRLATTGMGLAGLPRGVFLAVSAFCSAGLTPWSGSLVPFARDPFVLGVVTLLCLAGALGPGLLLAIPDLARGRKVPAHVRFVLALNLALFLLPAAVICAFEWNGAFGNLPAHDRVFGALLLSASARTAGFASVDLGRAELATGLVLAALMFVGGNTGSTAGGIRVSTAAVLGLAAWSVLVGRRNAEVGGRQIPHRSVYEAVAVAGALAATVTVALLALELTHHLPLEQSMFEVVSAATTCGLSLGATPELDGIGKLVLVATMFAGRVGPLTLLTLLVQERGEGGASYPSEEVPVG